MTGVMIWQQLVQGCFDCSSPFLRNSAFSWEFYFTAPLSDD